MRLRLIAAAALLVPLPAQAMSVADFLGKADALKAKGMGAMFSPDLKRLRTEIDAASAAYRGGPESKPPRSCPPPKGKAKINSNDLLAHFRSVRPTTSVTAAFAGMMIGRYPCR